MKGRVIVVDFDKREVVDTYEGVLQHNPRALEAMASQLLGDDPDRDLDALDGDLTPYDEDVSEEHQGRGPWFKFFLRDGG